MLFQLVKPLPEQCIVACSGGKDSMAAAHWLACGHLAGLQYVHHGTPHAHEAEDVVRAFAQELEVEFRTTEPCPVPPDGFSKEAFWRDYRYATFHALALPVVTAHTLDDCLEQFIMSAFIRGNYGTIPYRNNNVIRPFRLWSRKSIAEYVGRYNIKTVEDPSNTDERFKRNFVRKQVVPVIRRLNPGVETLVARQIWRLSK